MILLFGVPSALFCLMKSNLRKPRARQNKAQHKQVATLCAVRVVGQHTFRDEIGPALPMTAFTVFSDRNGFSGSTLTQRLFVFVFDINVKQRVLHSNISGRCGMLVPVQQCTWSACVFGGNGTRK